MAFYMAIVAKVGDRYVGRFVADNRLVDGQPLEGTIAFQTIEIQDDRLKETVKNKLIEKASLQAGLCGILASAIEWPD